MIASAMHRLATRLGLRDGQAYTVVCGLVVALVLAGVGLPGVFRGHPRPALAELADGRGPAPAAGAVDAPPKAPTPAEALPALAPATGRPRPTGGAVPATRPGPVPVASSEQQPAPEDDGHAARRAFAEVPGPGAAGGVAVGPDGTVWVVSDDTGEHPSALQALSPSGALVGTWDAPDQPADRAQGLAGVAVSAEGTVWVADAATSRLLRLDDRAGALVPVAQVPDLPACGLLRLASPCEPGLVDRPPLSSAIAVSSDGAVLVADRAQGAVWRLDGSELSILVTLDDRLPGEGPVGLSFASADELVIATSARRTSFPPGLPAVLQLRLRDGRADAAPVVIADLGVGEVPDDVVVGASGRAYVTIPSAASIADIGIDQGDRIDIRGDHGEPTFTDPRAVTLRPGSLLVRVADDLLLDLAVDDRPVT